MKRFSLGFFLFLAAAAGPLNAQAGVLAADAVVPGFGAFYAGRPVAGSAIAAGRISTLYMAYYFHQRELEYRSAENAARIAEFYFGPGYRFKNPYGGGYYSAAEFHQMAGRREFYSHLSLFLHVGITVASLYTTNLFLQADAEMNGPVFPEPQARVSIGMRF